MSCLNDKRYYSSSRNPFCENSQPLLEMTQTVRARRETVSRDPVRAVRTVLFRRAARSAASSGTRRAVSTEPARGRRAPAAARAGGAGAIGCRSTVGFGAVGGRNPGLDPWARRRFCSARDSGKIPWAAKAALPAAMSCSRRSCSAWRRAFASRQRCSAARCGRRYASRVWGFGPAPLVLVGGAAPRRAVGPLPPVFPRS